MGTRRKNDDKPEPKTGDHVTEPLNSVDIAQRELEQTRDETEADKKELPTITLPPQGERMSRFFLAEKTEEEIKAEQKKLFTEEKLIELQQILDIEPVAKVHSEIARAYGYAGIASNFKMLEQGIQQLKKRLADQDYLVDKAKKI